MSKYYLGIDPGLSGAIAVLDNDGKYIAVHDMPIMAKGKGHSTVKNQVNATELNQIIMSYVGCNAVLEAVNARPGQGVASMFSLGDSFGTMRAILAANGISINLIAPQTWKKHFKLNKDKEIARAKAIELFPQASLARKKDNGRAEALLMARFGYEQKI